MSPVQHLREFINARLNAAAEAIFSEFAKTIVQYEEEIDRQRKLVDVTWKPQRTVDETVQEDQQLCNQTLNLNLDQEQPESSSPIKEEDDELPTSQEEELLLKDETDNVSITAAPKENGHRDPESNWEHIYSHTFPADDNSFLERNRVDASGPARYADRKIEKCQTKTNENEKSCLLETHCNTHHTAEKHCFSDTCGKSFLNPSSFKRHTTIHENQYCCKTCGETFQDRNRFTAHVRFHSGEKLFSCKACGKSFVRNYNLLCHMRTHTGEKPYSCKTCGRCFSHSSDCLRHTRTHTGEKPYSCKICGKCFNQSSALVRHMRTHKDEKSYSCQMCGQGFHKAIFLLHIKNCTGRKPYSR